MSKQSLDGIIKPANESELTCYIRIERDKVLKAWRQKKAVQLELELHKVGGSLLESCPIVVPYEPQYEGLLQEDITDRKVETKEHIESLILNIISGAITFYVIDKCTKVLTKKRKTPSKQIDKALFRYLSHYDFQLLIWCDSKSICHGVVEEVHSRLRDVYKYSKICTPSLELISKCNNPIATICPKEFESSLLQEIKKPFLIDLELEGFAEETGIVGLMSIHGENNPPAGQDGTVQLDADFNIEETLDKLYPRRLDNV